MRTLLAALLLVACEGCRPTPPVPPPDGPGTCEDYCAAIAPLNGCGVIDVPHCVPDCHDEETSERDEGKRFPLGCLTTAAKMGDCGKVKACK